MHFKLFAHNHLLNDRLSHQDSAQRAFSTAGDTLNKHREAVSWGGDRSKHSAEEVFGKRHVSSDGS